MLANLVVALIVTIAFAQASARYLPAAWRRQAVHLLVRAGLPQARMAAWMRTESSCGTGCSSCKACEVPALDEASPPPAGGKRVIKIQSK
jgi:hypothetical protein